MLSLENDSAEEGNKQCTLAIVPVKVKVSKINNVIHTYVFLDPASSATFCMKSLCRQLNITGKNTAILLRSMGQEKTVSSSVVVGLEVSSMELNEYSKLPEAYRQVLLPVSREQIPQAAINKWRYLSEVQIPQIDADIGLLIGMNAAKLIERNQQSW